MADLDALVESLSALTVLEAAELKKRLEDKWGVQAAVGGGMMRVTPEAVEGETAKTEEKTEFDVHLVDHGAQKIQVIKTVRALTGLGLKEAKALVDNVPKPIKEGVSKEEAETIKKAIEEVGGQVEIK